MLEWLAREKKKHFDVTTMFTYSQANTPLGQSERAYCLSYFIKYLSKIYFHLRWLHKSGPRIFLNHCFSGIFLLLRSNTSWWIPRKKWSTAGSLLAFYFVLESVVLTLTGSVIHTVYQRPCWYLFSTCDFNISDYSCRSLLGLGVKGLSEDCWSCLNYSCIS